ncbi:FAD/NAD(P)-binding protein [Lentzea sp. NPDC042327]|uniref:FAD/NAD(P)-binding protein n=1 Tax=Lentzea sp. NPDC042327 TaxID=3154801 RepID=UPI0033F0462D
MIAVIGAGAAGVTTAARLLERGAAVCLVDPAEERGRGVAYRTDDPRHLLNVPAGKMSAREDDPGDFARWAGVAAADFVPRRVFGAYLAAHLDGVSARHPGRLRVVRDRATRIGHDAGAVRISLAAGDFLLADAAVLALGAVGTRDDWVPTDTPDSAAFVPDPWAPGALERIRDDRDVVLVGTGLTAVDLAMTLGRPGRVVHAVSRTGLLPRRHRPAQPMRPPELAGCTGLDDVRRVVSAHVRESLRRHGDWRPALDSLRPVTARLWDLLPLPDRSRFLAEDLRSWEVHRHRMPGTTARTLVRLRRAGELRTHRTGVTGVRMVPGGVVLRLGDGTELTAGTVVNCTGVRHDVRRCPDPLVAGLLADGHATPGPLGLGFDTLPDGRVRGGAPLWTLGALRRGNLWETTAFPEIRAQAAAVARSVTSALGVPC